MLTPPKWQSVWLKGPYSSSNTSKKTMVQKSADKTLDEISRCCMSTSKDLSLEALKCWKIWIESQTVDDWMIKEVCYSAVRSLITKKFHPLSKDVELTRVKLSMMWLIFQKVQFNMHLEGPQHVLEILIQSCLQLLSSDEIDPDMQKLSLELLHNLFSKESIITQNENFCKLESEVLQSSRLFRRYVNYFIEVFMNWGKIQDKTELIFIWKYFLDGCEKSFKLIPTTVWHKIFKLAQNICINEMEGIDIKIAFLHKCATCCKIVLSSSRYIDCSPLLTTPAEVLLRLAVELCSNDKGSNISPDLFNNCLELCRSLCCEIINSSGYEICVETLSKVEDMDSKPLLWAVWCGVANVFIEKSLDLSLHRYSKSEMKVYRKLRAVAANFDLDAQFLREEHIHTIRYYFRLLQIGCEHCFPCREKKVNDKTVLHNEFEDFRMEEAKEFETDRDENSKPFEIHSKEAANMSGVMCDLNTIKKRIQVLSTFLSIAKLRGRLISVDPLCDPKTLSDESRKLKNHLVRELFGTQSESNIKKFGFRCHTLHLDYDVWFLPRIPKRYLSIVPSESRRDILFAPLYLTLNVENLYRTRERSISSDINSLVANTKILQYEMREGRFFPPIVFTVNRYVSSQFYQSALHFWENIKELLCKVDFEINVRKQTSNSHSALLLCLILFISNLVKRKFLENIEFCGGAIDKNSLVEKEIILTNSIINLITKANDYTENFSGEAFIEKICNELPRQIRNPFETWINGKEVHQCKRNSYEHGSIILRDFRGSEFGALNEKFLGVFKYFYNARVRYIPGEARLLRFVECYKNDRRRRLKVRTERKRKFVSVMKRSNADVGIDSQIILVMKKDDVGKVEYQKDTEGISNDLKVDSDWTRDPLPRKEVKHETPKKRRPQVEMRRTRAYTQRSIRLRSDATLSEIVNESDKKENFKKCTKCSRYILEDKSSASPANLSKPYVLRNRPLRRPSKFDNPNYLIEGSPKRKTPSKNSEKKNEKENEFSCTCEETKSTPNIKCDNPVDPCLILDQLVQKEFTKTDLYGKGSQESCEKDNRRSKNLKRKNNTTVAELRSESSSLKIDSTVMDMVDSLISRVEELEKEENRPAEVVIEEGKTDPSGEKWKINYDLDESQSAKKIKLEEETFTIEDSRDLQCNEMEVKLEEGQSSVTAEDEVTPVKMKESMQKSLVTIVNSRASRMIALVTESPKFENFHNSPVLSKQQPVKPSNMRRNSRASKMLALLPEFQEFNVPGSEESSENLKSHSIESGRGPILSIVHHTVPLKTGSPSCGFSSPKTPTQRRSIRFDDDKNEIVTYYKDSPPCCILVDSPRFKGSKT